MATYTTEVRRLVENHFDLGLKDYPIFDENYRGALNDKIIKHYYFREIGFETAGLFKWHLNQKLNEIMPYYNQLYKSELIKFNPLYNVDRTTKNDGIKNGNSSHTGNSTTTGSSEYDNSSSNDSLKNSNSSNVGNSKTTGSTENSMTTTNKNDDVTTATSTDLKNTKKVHSDTPQGLLSINNIEDEIYASDADYNTDVDNNTSNQSNSSLGESKQSGSNTNNVNVDSVDNSTNNETASNLSHDTGNSTNNLSVDNIDNNTTNSTESYLAHVIGKEGSETYSEMLMKYRQTFLNIDMMIIDDLAELFMNVY